MATSFFGGNFFGGEFFNAGVTPTPTPTPTGGKGDNGGDGLRAYKPTGLTARKRGDPKVEKRVLDSQEIAREVSAEVAARLDAERVSRETAERAALAARQMEIEVDREIGILLRKVVRTEEEDVMLFMLLAAAATIN